jgi:hypothetical protein
MIHDDGCLEKRSLLLLMTSIYGLTTYFGAYKRSPDPAIRLSSKSPTQCLTTLSPNHLKMFGVRLFTFITAALAGSTIVSAVVAGPNVARTPGSGAVEAIAVKRQATTESQINSVLTTLQANLNPTLAQISTFSTLHVLQSRKLNDFVSCTWKFRKR